MRDKSETLSSMFATFRDFANIMKLAHIRMDFAGIMQTIGIKGRYVEKPLYFDPFGQTEFTPLAII